MKAFETASRSAFDHSMYSREGLAMFSQKYDYNVISILKV